MNSICKFNCQNKKYHNNRIAEYSIDDVTYLCIYQNDATKEIFN